MKELSIYPIICNLDTSTYNLTKHLVKLFPTLSTPEYNVSIRKKFMTTIKKYESATRI